MKSGFTPRDVARLEERCGIGVRHLYKFMELVLNEAMVRPDLLRAYEMRRTFSARREDTERIT